MGNSPGVTELLEDADALRVEPISLLGLAQAGRQVREVDEAEPGTLEVTARP
jgi:hypothetical protein